jgi:hypothetical protein
MTMEDSTIIRMSHIIQDVLVREKIRDGKPKDLMPHLIEKGFFTRDQREGLPLREILRNLEATGRLGLIPQVKCEKKEINSFWFFNPSSDTPYFINIENIYAFHKLIKDDPFNRYNSWQHCYEAFKNLKIISDDNLALHLGFYLASWGMYRGSTGLLQKDYKIHIGAVRIIKKYQNLRCNATRGVAQGDIAKIIELKSELFNHYNQYEYLNNKNEFKKKPPTDVLLSKIVMGTLGCTPAFDAYFNKGVGDNFSFKRFDENSLNEILAFIQRFNKKLKELQQFFVNEQNVYYPLMKIVDMYFWQEGYLKDKQI